MGPDRIEAGTLATFEIVPPQEAAWSVHTPDPLETVSNHAVDTAGTKIYFAGKTSGLHTVVAAVIVEGKPILLAKTFRNEGGVIPNPMPNPPGPPAPPSSLKSWIETNLPIFVTSKDRDRERVLLANGFEEVAGKIEAGTIRTQQNAQAQLQIEITNQLARVSETAFSDWREFLSQLSVKIDADLKSGVTDLKTVAQKFRTVAGYLKSIQSK